MSEQCLIAEYESLQDATLALRVLETANFTDQNVSVVSQGDDKTFEQIQELKSQHTDSPPAEGAVATGAMTGGAMATPLAVATLIGPFMVAGPLAGMAAGSALGALFSSTDRWGVDHQVAEDYENRVNNGSVLVFVNDADPIRIDDAERLLKTSDHQSIQRFQSET